jgi:prephenate dehydrogenase (NADP+)
MGTAWSNALIYPWEHGYYVGGIETVKVNIMLRIYSNKWHVYAGLAILNPHARTQIDQYARSASDIFKLMLNGDGKVLRERMYWAREKVFGDGNENPPPILLSEEILDQFSLGKPPLANASQTLTSNANSHLSLLAMVDCWAHLHIQPFYHLSLAATPVFRLWIGVAEYLFRSQARLDAAIDAALHDVSHRSDDLEFVVAARGWSQCVRFGNFELYKKRFIETATFFDSRFAEANRVGDAMIRAIMERSRNT